MERINTHTSTDDGVLSYLPDDALQPVTPYRPEIVSNFDDLHGTYSPASYMQKLAETHRDFKKKLIAQAASDGHAVAFTKSHVYPVRADNYGSWPVVLALLLIQHPEKAKMTNEALLKEVAEYMDISPLSKSYMSNPLSKKQRFTVADLLEKHGYAKPQFKNGTEIRKLIQTRSKQGQPAEPVNVRFKLFAQGNSISVAGKVYTLHGRRAKAKGDPLRDLEIHVRKSRIPLGDVLELLGVEDKAHALLGHA